METIPVTHKSAVEEALMKTFGSTSFDQLEPLSGGLSGSKVFKLLIQGHAYVLKLYTQKTSNDAAAALAPDALTLASDAELAPKLYYRDPSAGITISAFIENSPVWTAWPPERLVKELAKTVRSVHNIPCTIQGQTLKNSLEAAVSEFLNTQLLTGPIIDEIISYYEIVKTNYPWDDPDKVFSHNDINPGNLLCDGTRLWLVDWDAAFVTDRYVDLAIAANFFVQTEGEESELLDVYFDGVVDEYKKARFYLMRQIARLFFGIRLVQMAARNKPKAHLLDPTMEGNTLKALGDLMRAGKISLATYDGQLMCGKANLNEALHNLRSPRFAHALNQL